MGKKAQRKAAGYVCHGIFHGINAAISMIRTIEREMYPGLNPKELDLLAKHRKKLHNQGELFRQLGWRFING
jgi:hypothetical protein